MASSDEEGEIMPDCVTNYHFVNSSNTPISFSVLPLYWSDHKNVIEENEQSAVYMQGTTDGGLQSLYKEVIGWKFDLYYAVPEVYMLSKGKLWIKLQKPRKSYKGFIKNVMIVISCLHFAKRNVDATRDQVLSDLMETLSSYDVAEPLEKCLSAHVPLIQNAVAKDKDLAKSKYLRMFLMDIENPGWRKTLHEENQTTSKSQFIVSDDEMEIDDDSDADDDDDDGLFDAVCAFCDNGGDVLPCEGQCIRSFHPTLESGIDTGCESLGFKNAAQYEAIPTFLCYNCKHQRHQCFVCGKLGSSDKSAATEVFPCASATCGHFYHPECVAKMLEPADETLANKLKSQIAAGGPFTCPIHKCIRCGHGENKEIRELQFAVCRRCPKAYHRKCLPETKPFQCIISDGTFEQRTWDDLLPKRILMYCKKHKMAPNIGTPERDHLLFPCIVRKKNQDGTIIEKLSEKKSNAFGNRKETETKIIPKVVKSQYNAVTYGDNRLEKSKSHTMHEKRSSFENKKSISRNSKQPSNSVKNKVLYKDIQREQHLVVKPEKKIAVTTPTKLDTDMKARILKLVKDTTSSFDFEDYINEKKRKCSHEIYAPQTGLDKAITMGKVEASVKAVRTALKILEDGGSVQDAKAVCEPNVLNQLARWKKKLHVFLAPFLIGPRYTSFGRHFTKVDKLKEIVERLHWYVEDGDMIVDFCCGSNDFSWFMKEKLDSTGKRCRFRNYDLITPKNTFQFEKRDWFRVKRESLADDSRLIIGLNPPFGVQASLANKFIDHALKFKPKLLILIVPEETRRLDQNRSPYDLIWEEADMLAGKSFYLPGSIDIKDQPLDDWNIRPPPLSLWSHPDWTKKHKTIAEQHGHIEASEQVVSNYLMEEKHDCFQNFSNIMTEYPDISTILDDIPEEPIPNPNPNPPTINLEDTNMSPDTHDDMADGIILSSPVISSTNSRSEPTTLNPPLTQPNYYEPYPGYGQPQFAPTGVPYGPGPPVDFRYSLSGQHTYPTPYYGQGDYPTHPPYTNYGYPTQIPPPPPPPPNYGQPDFTFMHIWPPPGSAPPNHRYN